MLNAIPLEEVRLERHEAEHDDDADEEVEERFVRLQASEAVVEGEDFEDAVEVQEEEAVAEGGTISLTAPSTKFSAKAYANPLYRARKMTMGSVSMMRSAMVVTKRSSCITLTFASTTTASSGVTELVRLAVLEMTMCGRGSRE